MKNQPVLPISNKHVTHGSFVPSGFPKYQLAAAALLALWLLFQLCADGSEPASSTQPSYILNKRPANEGYIELANFDNNGVETDAFTLTTTNIIVSEFVPKAPTAPTAPTAPDLVSGDDFEYSQFLVDEMEVDYVLDDDDIPEEEYVIEMASPLAEEAVQKIDEGVVVVDSVLVPDPIPVEKSQEKDSVAITEQEHAPSEEEDLAEDFDIFEEELDFVHDDDDEDLLEDDDDDENFATPLLKEVFETVTAHSLVIYSKTDCPYTQRAKQILAKYGVTLQPHVVEVDTLADPAEIQDALTSLTLSTTLPNIFIDGISVGDSDTLAELDASGELRELLEKAGVLDQAEAKQTSV